MLREKSILKGKKFLREKKFIWENLKFPRRLQ
jgi:hypothetical protein